MRIRMTMRPVFAALAALAALAAVGTTGAADGAIGANEDKLASVGSGELAEARASWWGFNPEDSTDQLQKAFDSGVKRLVIDKMASDWVARPLNVRSDMEIVFEQGARIMAKRGEFRRGSDSLLNLDRSRNVTIRGGELRMWHDDYFKPPYVRAEWRHAINLSAAKNVLIEDMVLADSGGDGVYVGATPDDLCEDIVLRRVVSDGNGRQGISVISVDGLEIDDCVFKNTGGAMPMAGIDLEPNSPREKLKGIRIRNSLFENNTCEGISFYLPMLDETTDPLDVEIENCVVRHNGGNGFGFTTPENGKKNLKGRVVVRNCRFEENGGGIMIDSKGIGGNALEFHNVQLVNKVAANPNAGGGRPSIQIFSGGNDGEPAGGIVFDNVEIIAPVERMAFNYGDTSFIGVGVKNVTGRITVRREVGGPAVETIDLNDEYLAKNYPDINPRKLAPVATNPRDFVP